jgi:hypothetical protein
MLGIDWYVSNSAIKQIAEKRRKPRLGKFQQHVKRTVMSYLRDPEASKLSDREISRRSGLSATTVGTWRKRLAANEQSS